MNVIKCDSRCSLGKAFTTTARQNLFPALRASLPVGSTPPNLTFALVLPSSTLADLLLLRQCDEGHPTCRNCVKSKRDCLGYDPIFKSSSGPSSIQPSPTPNQSSISNSPSQPYQSSVYTTTARSQSQSINNESPRSSVDRVDFPTPTSRDTTFSPPGPPLRADGGMDSSSTGDGGGRSQERPFIPIRSGEHGLSNHTRILLLTITSDP